MNCGALTETLLESELFGHSRGAFTGAVQSRAGVFEASNSGTLFLDEIGELSARAQASLLRVLQEGSFRRIGETQTRVDVGALHDVIVEVAQKAATLCGQRRPDLGACLRVELVGVDVARVGAPERARSGHE